MRNNISPLTQYQGIPLITPRQGVEPFSYYHNYLQMARNLLDRALNAHGGVITVFRIDLTYPDDKVWSNPMRFYDAFISQYRRVLTEQSLDPQYLIRMEQRGANPHFHVAIVVRGAVNAWSLKELANEIWMSVLSSSKQLEH